MVNPMLQMVEGVERRVDIQNDIASPPTVAPIGATARDKLFFAEGNDTVAAIPRFYIDTRTIVKHCLVPPNVHFCILPQQGGQRPICC
jgi:hypothetical protein